MGTTESTMAGGGGGGKGVNKGPFTDAEYALVVQVRMYVVSQWDGRRHTYDVCKRTVWSPGVPALMTFTPTTCT